LISVNDLKNTLRIMRNDLTNEFLFKISERILGRNSKFHNLHRGESCYLFGNGSSLKYFDLEQFSDRIGIGCGQLFLHKDYSRLNLKYYYSGHPFFYYPFWTNQYLKKFEKNRVGAICRENISKNKQTEYFISLSNYFGLRGENIFYVHHFDTSFDENKYDLDKKFTYIDGSLSAMLGMALFMGFNEITLIGCDYTWKPRHHGHFFEFGKRPDKIVSDKFSEKPLSAAKKNAKISTITINDKYTGQLIPSITYKDFTGKDLIFKENHEIIESIDLLKLDKTNMMYRIYDEE